MIYSAEKLSRQGKEATRMSHPGNDYLIDLARDEDEETEKTLSETLDEIESRISPEIRELAKLSREDPEEFKKVFRPLSSKRGC